MTDGKQRAILVGIDMPFWHMVDFMIKWALATIPAAIVLAAMGAIVFGGLALIGIKLF